MSFIRKLSGKILKKVFFSPPYVYHSVQTIYKSLQGAIYLYEYNKSKIWLEHATYLAKLLSSIQQPDGGFDVGYNYPFGSTFIHKRGNSLACESTAILVLGQYNKIKPTITVQNAIRKGISWIANNSKNVSATEWAIPYDPTLAKEIAIINATSFASSALGANINPSNIRLQEIYLGMITFLDNKLLYDPKRNGKYWLYFDNFWIGTPKQFANKIDYYHLAQQIEVHCISQAINPVTAQIKFIEEGADYLCSIHNEFGIIPYDNCNNFDGYIHTWGLASVVSSMLEVAILLPQKKKQYIKVAKDNMFWLLNNAWNGEYFYDILTIGGNPISKDYMVRSDAWCFQACSAYTKYFGSGNWEILALKCFDRMSSKNFSGREKHGKKNIQLVYECFKNKYFPIN